MKEPNPFRKQFTQRFLDHLATDKRSLDISLEQGLVKFWHDQRINSKYLQLSPLAISALHLTKFPYWNYDLTEQNIEYTMKVRLLLRNLNCPFILTMRYNKWFDKTTLGNFALYNSEQAAWLNLYGPTNFINFLNSYQQ